MTDRTATRLAWGWAGLTLLIVVGTAVLAVLNRAGIHTVDDANPIEIILPIGYALVGALVASRRPENAIGWIFLGLALVAAFPGIADQYVRRGLLIPGSLPGLAWAVWVSQWSVPIIFPAGLVVFAFLLFPEGHLPSPRWRVLAWLAVVTSILFTMVGALQSPIRVSSLPPFRNPLGASAFARFWNGWPGAILFFSGMGMLLAACVAVVRRFRRAQGDEKQQLRWFAYAGLATISMLVIELVVSIFVRTIPEGLYDAIIVLGFGIALPAACGVAILKYRLYDLDVVLKKTVVFTVLAAFITLLGAGAVAFASVGGLGLHVVTTAAILALAFNPVRRFARWLADRLVYGKRATPSEVLSEFSERLAGAYSADDVLPRMANLLCDATGAESVSVWLAIGRQLRPIASWPPGESVRAPIAGADGRLPEFGVRESGFEVRHQGELLGAMTVRMPANDPMDATREKLARELGSQAGLVLRNVQLIEELRASRQRIVAAQDARAKALERNIHDGAQQQLVALAIKLKLARSAATKDPASTEAMLAGLQDEAQDALENLRDLARGIYPPLLADKGLFAALDAQVRKAPLPVSLDPDGVGRLPQEVEAAVYFCALEALQNAAKYARASSVTVRLSASNETVLFEVEDDGQGFDTSQTGYGTGLQGMADRLEALGGSLRVHSTVGAGTTVEGRLPVGSGDRKR